MRRIARQGIGQRRLRLCIAAPWHERYCPGSILAGYIRVAEQRLAYRRVRLPKRGGLFLVAAASALHKEDVKVVQELLRHANSRITLDLYAQAGMPEKRLAQSKVVRMVLNERSEVA
jgi:integrase